MIDTPKELQIFIKLYTKSKLNSKQAKFWFQIVKNNLDAEIVDSIQIRDQNDQIKDVQMISKAFKKYYSYEIPLKRHLGFNESKIITNMWDAYYPLGEFLIVVSGNTIRKNKQDNVNKISIDENQYEKMCEELAKSQHQQWYKEKTEQGWKYGINFNMKNKTHPMLRPWQDLPADYKKIDYETPNKLLNTLYNLGYTVVKK